MTTQMMIRIDPDLKAQATRMAKAEGKNMSELVRELLVKYTRERDIGAYIDELWDRIGRDLKESRITEQDIKNAVRDVRRSHA